MFFLVYQNHTKSCVNLTEICLPTYPSIFTMSSSTTTQISRIFTGAVVSFSIHMVERLLFSLRGVNTIKRLTLYQYLAFRMGLDIP